MPQGRESRNSVGKSDKIGRHLVIDLLRNFGSLKMDASLWRVEWKSEETERQLTTSEVFCTKTGSVWVGGRVWVGVGGLSTTALVVLVGGVPDVVLVTRRDTFS